MTVTKTVDGRYAVIANSAIVAGPFETNSQAWRWIDRHEGEPISPAEKVSDWIVGKILGSATD